MSRNFSGGCLCRPEQTVRETVTEQGFLASVGMIRLQSNSGQAVNHRPRKSVTVMLHLWAHYFTSLSLSLCHTVLTAIAFTES